MEQVSIRTKNGGLSVGTIDETGRLVKMAGYWYPSSDPNVLDGILRARVDTIVRDGGETYKSEVRSLALSPEYKFAE
jgi:hypothetical protein